jgi:hypothetical protein
MITTVLMGGMGNQMFQYAIGRAAAMRLNTNLLLEISRFNDWMRQYSLGLWAGVTAPTIMAASGEWIREEGLPYNPMIAARITNDSVLFGYWQTEKYFSNIRSTLLNEFTPKAPLTEFGEEIKKQILAEGDKSVFLTIRRTDYVMKQHFHGVLPIDYYLRAMELIAAKVSDPHIFVFSDEPDWCKANLRLPYGMTVAGNYDQTTATHLGREDQELWLMRQCRHAVVANSSYSWWGAWMGADMAGGIIVAPQCWFTTTQEDPRDIVPERWIKL